MSRPAPTGRRSVAVTATAVLGVGLAGLTTVPTASAADPGHASGTCKTQNDAVGGWTSYPQLLTELERMERTSQGKVDAFSIATTFQGRDVMAARVGTGDKVALITGAIHGNERTGVESLLRIVDQLGSRGDAATQQLLSEVTLVAVPMLNPDGLELNQRVNDITWDDVVAQNPQLEGAPPAWYYRSGTTRSSAGFDLNRDFHPDLDYVPTAADLPGNTVDPGFYLNAESQGLRDLYVDLHEEFGEVDVVVDLHHMGPCSITTGGPQDGKPITVTVDYPPLGVNDGAAYLEEYPLLDQDKSRRYALSVMDGITGSYGAQSPLAGVGRYVHFESREFAGQGRSAFALNGSASVLFEVRGQSNTFGQKMKGMMTTAVQTGVLSMLTAMADGTVETLDGDDFFDYPDYGWDTVAD
ncbi:M14 family zinc carboxypeptidase [Ornithinimicrobium pekingense]|uniref:Peptidase M14 domain-containing protein n=1 Tax=Ornithinimicrobium pekingense TaxID=384677 RepID=A0ABQ2FFJ6_9MICO|nr:M14 family zinc carboxypeptidase [Ornithinimicrobium pekingense]GGK82923.1 hypothetical protein GCM10011509_34280 [Ornithinimicrobium pekingense]